MVEPPTNVFVLFVDFFTFICAWKNSYKMKREKGWTFGNHLSFFLCLKIKIQESESNSLDDLFVFFCWKESKTFSLKVLTDDYFDVFLYSRIQISIHSICTFNLRSNHFTILIRVFVLHKHTDFNSRHFELIQISYTGLHRSLYPLLQTDLVIGRTVKFTNSIWTNVTNECGGRGDNFQ